jgi:hypothetical protein
MLARQLPVNRRSSGAFVLSALHENVRIGQAVSVPADQCSLIVKSLGHILKY